MADNVFNYGDAPASTTPTTGGTVDPITLALITGGTQLLSSLLGGNSSAQQAQAQRELEVSQFAQTFGLDQQKLQSQIDQFKQQQAQQLKEYMMQNGIDQQQLQEKIKEANTAAQQFQQTAAMTQNQQNIQNQPMQDQQARMAQLRKALLVPGTPNPMAPPTQPVNEVPKNPSMQPPNPLVPPQAAPNATPVMPGATSAAAPVPKNLGAQALNPTTGA